MEHKIFHSKVDMWLLSIIIFALGLVFLPLILADMSFEKAFEIFLLQILAGIFGLVSFCLMARSCKYIFYDDFLHVKCFPFISVKIKYSDIRAFYDSHNIASAPAFSLDRIRIDFGEKKKVQPFTLVSPKDKKGFYAELESRTGILRT